jgi:hypothetical protein
MVNFTLGADSMVVLGGLLWLMWDRAIKPVLIARLDRVFTPLEEERRINILLAQIGLLTGATRVILAAFHNGDIDSSGYHLIKLSTTNSYTAPGHLPMTVPIRDLPIRRIQTELAELLAPGAADWVSIEYHDDLPAPCRDHLRRNNIDKMYNRLVRIGTLPIGLLSLQFEAGNNKKDQLHKEPYVHVLETLFEDLAGIIRRRIVKQGPVRRLFARLRGGNSTAPWRS